MKRFMGIALVILIVGGLGLRAQSTAAPAAETTELRSEIEQLKKTVQAMEQRLAEQEKAQHQKQTEASSTATAAASASAEVVAKVKDLDRRMTKSERDAGLSRVRFSGDYRFEGHTIWGDVPAHYDGMKLQSLVVKTMFAMNVLGRPPMSVNEINNTVAGNFSNYQYFSQNLTFDQLKTAMGQFPAAMQQQLIGMLMPSTLVPRYSNDTDILYTNRLRLRLDSQVSDNLSVTARLSMYKVFGDSTGVQVFNGQPNTLNIDGTTSGVPNSDMLRVERAFFTWKNIGGSKLYLSIGRRPSTAGPPLTYRDDEPRGGTPSGALIDYQFDGITAGYRAGEHTELRACYGVGYQSGFGNGNLLKMPQDRLKDVHFLGANLDLWDSEKMFVQATIARAFNVTDGFNGLMVLPNNPVTGDVVGAPVVMRFTPSANLGNINLVGVNFSRRLKDFDLFVSGNYVGLRPNSLTTPFGGLMSDPFETPANHDGSMFYFGVRYNLPQNDGRTKFGFEFNHGSKYWFNFAQAEDDIIAPKTNTRGDVFETYVTHRISQRFIFKLDYMRYNYAWSGSGWHLGAPKKLDSLPVLGFPTYDRASMLSFGLTTRF